VCSSDLSGLPGALRGGGRTGHPSALSYRRRADAAAAFRSALGACGNSGAGRIPRTPSGRRPGAGAAAAVAGGAAGRSAAGGDVGHARYGSGGGVSGRGAGDAVGGPAVSARNRIHAALGGAAGGAGESSPGASGGAGGERPRAGVSAGGGGKTSTDRERKR